MNMFNLVFSIMGIVVTVLLFGNQAFAYGGYGGYGGYRVAFSNSYSHSSNNTLFDRSLLSSDKSICFSSNDKLVDPNNNNWTHVLENTKNSVVKVVTVSN